MERRTKNLFILTVSLAIVYAIVARIIRVALPEPLLIIKYLKMGMALVWSIGALFIYINKRTQSKSEAL